MSFAGVREDGREYGVEWNDKVKCSIKIRDIRPVTGFWCLAVMLNDRQKAEKNKIFEHYFYFN